MSLKDETIKHIIELLKPFELKKAPNRSRFGSNYDYMFKCGDHYVSLSDIEVVLRTGRKPILLYCNTEDIINFVKRTLRYVEIDFDNIVKEKTKQGIRND